MTRRFTSPARSAAGDAGSSVAPEDRARELCLAALERRRHSRRELERKLREREVTAEVAARVLDRLTEVGLVDDLAYARAYVESRQRRRPRGGRGLAAELAARGVAPEVIATVLGEEGEREDPAEAARRAVASKLRSLAGRPRDEARRKAADFLSRRGFSYDTVRRVLDEALPGAGDDEASG